MIYFLWSAIGIKVIAQESLINGAAVSFYSQFSRKILNTIQREVPFIILKVTTDGGQID